MGPITSRVKSKTFFGTYLLIETTYALMVMLYSGCFRLFRVGGRVGGWKSWEYNQLSPAGSGACAELGKIRVSNVRSHKTKSWVLLEMKLKEYSFKTQSSSEPFTCLNWIWFKSWKELFSSYQDFLANWQPVKPSGI